ncbi:MAG: lipocalin family protein [Melioribacteraceae bacterium]|jgi:hypothetical protein|nr:lipocalin family protein [Melioribacteraceae bacterium]
MKKYNFIYILLISLLIVTACGKDDNPTESNGDNLVGTWVLTKITIVSGGNLEISPATIGTSATIIIRSDRTFTATTTDSEGTSTETGTWSVANGKITMKTNDGSSEEIPYTVNGNKLTIETVMEIAAFGEVQAKLEFTKQ